MRAHSLSHLSNAALLRDLAALVARDRTTTVELLLHLAEVDARRLYAPAGCSSMFKYCVRELRLSEEVAFKRIRAARAARRFPAIFDALADGRLHITGVSLLAPRLTPENADELLAAATHRTKSQIEHMLAQRFPQPDVPTSLRALPSSAPSRSAPQTDPQLDPDPVVAATSPPSSSASQADAQLDPDPVAAVVHAPEPCDLARSTPSAIAPPGQRPKVVPLAPRRYALHLTIGQETHDKLRQAQALLSHAIPSGDIPEVLDRALDLLIVHLEKRKFAATAKPRPGRERATTGGRTIPASVKRAVRERDQDQCTYVSDSGCRCDARKFLEFDHGAS